MSVEGRCRLVLGIHDQGIGGNLGTDSTVERIGQQCAAQPLPFESLIDGQAAHANRWDGRIARQLLADAVRKIGQQQACRRQRVVARDALPFRQRHEAGSHTAANILGDLFPQIALKRF